jgi:hypothetical protein
MGAVNHYRSHCRLARFILSFDVRGKYSSLVGRKRVFVCAQYEFPGFELF